ncbi:antitoxin VapB [Rhizobium azooxidifex]|uniref:Antitoxin VapB n=1 Tax=Mycoplana azooxidifex TaxID=1636188 RepID=A0A7W6GIE3_9HYPH|nr:type II toxin-antitoxin system VapB family antitoxin [Mycoplana azooxidifex]MBB3976083.1 antitoxin VapB [Mycoplana azooxidifex]
MPLNIKDETTHELARQLAERTGESLTRAVRHALEEKLARLRAEKPAPRLADQLDRIALDCAALPVLDRRSPEDIIGYDEDGLPQ